MTISQAIDQLTSPTSTEPDEALQCLREGWKDAEPLLLNALDQTLTNPCHKPPALFLCAFFLCAEMRSQAAFEHYIKICRLTTPLIDSLIGANVVRCMGVMLARTCYGRFGELKAVIEDESLDGFARVAPLEALSDLTGAGEFPCEAFKSYCLDLLDFRLEAQKGLIWCGVVFHCIKLGLTQALPLIEDAYANGFINDRILPFEDVVNKITHSDGSLERDEDNFQDLTDETMQLYFSERADNLQTPNEAERQRVEELLEQLQQADQLKMLACQAPAGRNDPCPCGSGIKFKKCCINEETVNIWRPQEPANYADQLIDCGYSSYEREQNGDAFICWNQAWREIIDTNMISENITDPQAPECELFDCCESFLDWIDDLLSLITAYELLPVPSLNNAVIIAREFLHKFPAMTDALHAQAEYALAVLLAATGKPDEAETLFNQSLSRSTNDAVELLRHACRSGINAHNLNMHPNWENALEYAEKAMQLQDERLTQNDTVEQYIQKIKSTIELRTLRRELSESQ